jgi:hypothetical protein
MSLFLNKNLFVIPIFYTVWIINFHFVLSVATFSPFAGGTSGVLRRWSFNIHYCPITALQWSKRLWWCKWIRMLKMSMNVVYTCCNFTCSGKFVDSRSFSKYKFVCLIRYQICWYYFQKVCFNHRTCQPTYLRGIIYSTCTSAGNTKLAFPLLEVFTDLGLSSNPDLADSHILNCSFGIFIVAWPLEILISDVGRQESYWLLLGFLLAVCSWPYWLVLDFIFQPVFELMCQWDMLFPLWY